MPAVTAFFFSLMLIYLSMSTIKSNFPCSPWKNVMYIWGYTYHRLRNTGLEGIGELKMWWCWCLTCAGEMYYPKSVTDFLHKCNEYIFPTVRKLIKFFYTILITTATNGRPFSIPRRLKCFFEIPLGKKDLMVWHFLILSEIL